MKLITAVNDLDTIFEIDLEGEAMPAPPAQLRIGDETVVTEEIIGRQGNIVAVRVIRGFNLKHTVNQKLHTL